MKDIIVIVGPTGIGKTKLSIELAKILDGEIINGDSVSIYKRLDIGSAKPTKEEQSGIIHHLIDIKDVNEDYTVFDYQKDAREKIEEIEKKGKRVIIVGGTGLYIKAALYDYKFTEGTTYNEYKDLTNEEILSKIKEYNTEQLPEVNNRKRLVRLLNKLENNEEITNNKDKLIQLSNNKYFKDPSLLVDKVSLLLDYKNERLKRFSNKLDNYQLQIDKEVDRMGLLLDIKLNKKRNELDRLNGLLKAYSCENTLKRGYALVYKDNKLINKDINNNDKLVIETYDQIIDTRVEKVSKKNG